MNPDIRPQDDLFGHVNGRWLDETEIPSDRSSWGPFVQLADVAEAAGPRHHRDLARGDTPAAELDDEDARKIGDLFASFMDERPRSTRWAPARSGRCRRRGRPARRPRPGGVPRRVRADRRRTASSGPTSTPTTATPTATSSTSPRAASGCPTSPTTARTSSPRSGRSTSPTSPACSSSAEHADAAAPRPRPCSTIDTRLAAGHWERAETRDVQKTYNLMTLEELRALCPAFDWDAYVTQPRRQRRRPSPSRACASRPTSRTSPRCSRRSPIEDWKAWLLSHVLRSAAPYLTDDFVETNFDFYGRTLNGTPELRERWKRGVALVEGALGEAVGKEYVARHFPPASKAKMDDLVANLLEAYRVLDRRARLDGRGDQAAGLREARHVPARRSATRRSSATTPRSRSAPAT